MEVETVRGRLAPGDEKINITAAAKVLRPGVQFYRGRPGVMGKLPWPAGDLARTQEGCRRKFRGERCRFVEVNRKKYSNEPTRLDTN